MTPDAQQPEQIEQLKKHLQQLKNDGFKVIADCESLSIVLASRPHTPAPEQCVYWGKKDGKNRCSLLMPDPALYVELTDAIKSEAARTATLAENKRVLDAFCDYIEGECYFTTDEMQDFIHSLRQQAGEQG
jgi:hypothetical protein